MKTIVLNIQKIIILRLSLFLSFLAFSIPFLISSSQLVTGIVVNSFFFIAAERLSKKALYPLLILPSLGTLLHGVVFGPQTIFLFYFLPFIWIGNYFLVNIFSLTKRQNYLIRVLFSAIVKYLLLFVAANIYFKAQIVPQLFINSMGITQFATACLGGIFAYFVIKSLKHE